MSWILCLFLSVLCLTAAFLMICYPLRRKADYIFLAVALMGFFSYLPHYLSMFTWLNAVIADAVNLLQIITVNSNSYESSQAIIPHTWLLYPYLLIRGIVHLATPVLFAYVAFTFLFTQLANLKQAILCHGRKKLFIFCEYNDLANIIVSDIQKNESGAVYLFLRDAVAENKHIDNVDEYIGHVELDKKSIISLENDQFLSFIRKYAPQKNKTIHIFCNEENSEKNINECLSVIQYCKKNLKETDLQRLHIDVFAKSNDSTASLIDSVNSGLLSIRIVDRCQIASSRLLMDHPLYEAVETIDGKDRICATVIGDNELALHCLKTFVWCGQMPGIGLELHLITDTGKRADIVKRLHVECPELLEGDYDITVHEADNALIDIFDEDLSFLKQTGYIVICGPDNEQNYNLALRLQRQYYHLNDYQPKCPLILPEISSTMRRDSIELMAAGLYQSAPELIRIFPFGDLNAIYSYKELIQSSLFRLGKNVNYAYEEYFNTTEDPLSPKFILEKAVGFKNSENSKKSNMAAALHMQYKLWMLGYEICEPDDPEKVPMDELRQLLAGDTPQLEQLCRAEHDRWVAYHRSEGWRTETPENIHKIYENRMGQKNKSLLLKTHIDICPYDDIRQRRALYGLEDSTPLDQAIIQRIPDILEDRWAMDGEKQPLSIRKWHRKK